MTEEIKNLLELFAFTNDDCMFCDEIKLNVKESKLLLNYITNLQKEKENYKSRNEKAVEYIKENSDMVDWLHCVNYDLLNILQGDDE